MNKSAESVRAIFDLNLEIALIEWHILRANKGFLECWLAIQESLRTKDYSDVVDEAMVDELVFLLTNSIFRYHPLREKALQLINAALEIGLDESDVGFGLIIRNKKVKEKGISTILKGFEKGQLSKVLKYRKIITHRRGIPYKVGNVYIVFPGDKESNLGSWLKINHKMIDVAFKEWKSIKRSLYRKLGIKGILDLVSQKADKKTKHA